MATLKIAARMVFAPDSGSTQEFSSGEITCSNIGAQFFRETASITTVTSSPLRSPAGGSTEGYYLIKNLDSTNYVTLYQDSGFTNAFAILKPGEIILFRPSTSLVYARADTATCLIEMFAVDGT